MKVAVIGATGAVGREMTRILEERAFPVDTFVPFASARSAGRQVSFRGEAHEVGELSVAALDGVEVAFISAGATTSQAFLPDIVAAHGTTCIDNSSAFRMDAGVPLADPRGEPRGARGLAQARDHRGAELHDRRGDAGTGPAPPRGGTHVARDVVVPGGERRGLEGDPRARRAGREDGRGHRVVGATRRRDAADARDLRETDRVQRRREGRRVRRRRLHRRGDRS